MHFFDRYWGFCTTVVEQYREKACQKSAAHLTYLTLFALVPVMTITYSMFSIFPAFDGVGDKIQSLVFSYFLPESGIEIQQYLNDFTSQARGLSWFGIIFLVVTAYMMLKNIEKAFNSVWGVNEARKGLANFLLYWAVLSLGPVLLGIGLAMSTYLISLKLLVQEYDPYGFLPIALKVSPVILTTIAFTLLFTAVPNCKVPFKHAFFGGLFTSIVFEVLKMLFGTFISTTSFSLIYGTFVIVPLFLFWVNLTWMVILAGAVIVRSLTTFKAITQGRQYPDLVAALLVLWEFKQRLAIGSSLHDGQLMQIGVDVEQWRRLKVNLLRHNIIAVTQHESYVLCRDLSGVTLRQLADIVDMRSQMPGTCDYLQDLSWFPNVAGRLLAIDQFTEMQFDVSLETLFIDDTADYGEEGQGLEMLHEALESHEDSQHVEESTPVAGAITNAGLQIERGGSIGLSSSETTQINDDNQEHKHES